MQRKPTDAQNFEPSGYEGFISPEEVVNLLIQDDSCILIVLVILSFSILA